MLSRRVKRTSLFQNDTRQRHDESFLDKKLLPGSKPAIANYRNEMSGNKQRNERRPERGGGVRWRFPIRFRDINRFSP